MIRYPNGKIATTCKPDTPQDSFKNRGLEFEDEINQTNAFYCQQNRAVIYKKPTPIKVVRVAYHTGEQPVITEAYFQQPSTTDYNGIYRGKYLDFEAKETRSKTSFPLKNLPTHQIQHLVQIMDQGGIGFLLVYFKLNQTVFLLDGRIVQQFFEQGKSSIPYTTFVEQGVEVMQGYLVRIPYLDAVDRFYFSSR